MILQSAVQYFREGRSKVCNTNGRKDVNGIPHIISSHMEHPAVTVMLEHLLSTGQAGLLVILIEQ